jgi:hypothetical protein
MRSDAARSTSIIPFLPRGAFDDDMTRLLGLAFDAACTELHDTGQPSVVLEILAKRIIEAAQKGEREQVRLRDAALDSLGIPKRSPI